MKLEFFTETCGECQKEYRVYYKQASKNEQVAYCQHLCHPSHIVRGDALVEDKFIALSVEFPVYLDPDPPGLGSTMRELESLTPAQWSILASVFGVKVGENTPRDRVHNVIKGHIQREWYMAAKGELKMSTQKNQEARAKDAAAPKKAKADGNGGTAEEKKARDLKKYKLASGKADEIAKLKGQAAQVVQAVKAVGAGDVKVVGAKLAENPDFKTRQTPERIAGYYFKMLADQGILVQAQ